jgi:hypothetical protein
MTMTESDLADVRRMVADLAYHVLRLPEERPSVMPAVGRAALADLLHACDVLIPVLAGQHQLDTEATGLLATLRAHRRLLFLVLAELEPQEMPARTEAARDREAALAAKMAAGLIPRFYTDQEFDATLRAAWLGEPGE